MISYYVEKDERSPEKKIQGKLNKKAAPFFGAAFNKKSKSIIISTK